MRREEGREGEREKKELPREEQAGVNSRRIFMGRLVEQGLRKLVNRLIALNDERRDFSGQQDREEEGLLERSSSFHTVETRKVAAQGAADKKGRGARWKRECARTGF